MPWFTWFHSNMVEGRGGRRGGGLDLGNRPGKSTGVHKFTVALLGHCTHTLSHTHTQNVISYSKTTFSFSPDEIEWGKKTKQI